MSHCQVLWITPIILLKPQLLAFTRMPHTCRSTYTLLLIEHILSTGQCPLRHIKMGSKMAQCTRHKAQDPKLSSKSPQIWTGSSVHGMRKNILIQKCPNLQHTEPTRSTANVPVSDTTGRCHRLYVHAPPPTQHSSDVGVMADSFLLRWMSRRGWDTTHAFYRIRKYTKIKMFSSKSSWVSEHLSAWQWLQCSGRISQTST